MRISKKMSETPGAKLLEHDRGPCSVSQSLLRRRPCATSGARCRTSCRGRRNESRSSLRSPTREGCGLAVIIGVLPIRVRNLGGAARTKNTLSTFLSFLTFLPRRQLDTEQRAVYQGSPFRLLDCARFFSRVFLSYRFHRLLNDFVGRSLLPS